MKNLFTLCLITLSSSLLFSQGDISFGVFGGFNYSVPLGDGVEELKDDIEDDLDDYEDSDYYDLDFARGGLFGRPGVHFGVNASYQANRELSIYSSLSYSQKGYIAFMHLKGEYENYWNGSSTQSVDYEYRRIEKLKLDYVDFPIGAKYKLSNSIEVFGGILFSFLLSDDDNVETSYYYELDGEDEDDDDDYDFDDYYEDEDPEDLLTGIQVGISHSVNNRVFSFTINKNSDFGNVGYDDNNDDWSNLTFQISSGITF